MTPTTIHSASQTDCISSIAYAHGFFWRTIWDHPENANLREQRMDPNVILGGDDVYIPERRSKSESASTEQRHRFRRKGVPALARFVLREYDGQPRSGIDWNLTVEGQEYQGQTGSDGLIEIPISPNARTGILHLKDQGLEEEFEILFGAMNPVDQATGAVNRLRNLGYEAREGNEESLAKALRQFQLDQNLDVTGKLDPPSQDALLRDHGS